MAISQAQRGRGSGYGVEPSLSGAFQRLRIRMQEKDGCVGAQFLHDFGEDFRKVRIKVKGRRDEEAGSGRLYGKRIGARAGTIARSPADGIGEYAAPRFVPCQMVLTSGTLGCLREYPAGASEEKQNEKRSGNVSEKA